MCRHSQRVPTALHSVCDQVTHGQINTHSYESVIPIFRHSILMVCSLAHSKFTALVPILSAFNSCQNRIQLNINCAFVQQQQQKLRFLLKIG